MEKLQNKKSIEHKILLILSHIKIINLVLTFFYIFCCAYVLQYTVSFTIYNAKDLLQINLFAQLYFVISGECEYLNMFPTEIQLKLDSSLNATVLSKYNLIFQDL